jgi:Tol biopolymer transport system component
MGVVWKARDTRLDRLVAVKVLPPHFGSDATGLRRFQREARAAAALCHPGIAAVYDTGEDDGLHYIVSEFVEGRTLRAVLGKGGALPRRRAVEIAIQLAEALSVAHASGIVHRDLKPENIVMTREGQAKILDFGLARVMSSRSGGDQATTVTLTREGSVVGTPGYMAPEQARGEGTDHRGDIFSLGLVLHEMLSGRRTFVRATTAETMAAIIKDDPEPLPAAIGPGLAAITAHCLEKDRDHRFQSVRDLAFALHSANGSSQTVPAQRASRPRRRIILLAAALTAVMVGGILAGAWLFAGPAIDVSRHRYTPIAVVPYARPITEGGGTGAQLPIWSPDAKSIVYSAGGLRLQRLDGFESVPLTARGVNPFFSPDGTRVYYLTSGETPRELWSVSVAGGTPELVLSDLGGFGPILDGVQASRDGESLVVVRPVKAGDDEMPVWISSPPGAAPRKYPGSPSGRNLNRAFLRFSPDRSKLLLTLAPVGEPVQWWLLPWPPPTAGHSNGVRRVFENGPRCAFGTAADWLHDSRHLIVALHEEGELGGPLWIADTATGSWHQITPGPFMCNSPRVSKDGRVLFHMPKTEEHSVEIPLDGTPIRQLIAGLRREQYPSWSPVADQILFVTNQRGEPEIWLSSRREGWQRPVVTQRDFPSEAGKRQFVSPVFSPEGTRMAYTSNGAIWISPVAGGPPLRICDGYCPTWSPDGEWLAFLRNSRAKMAELMKVRIGGRQAAVVICSSAGKWLPRWSPDGQWITAQLPEGFGVISPDGARSRVLYKGSLDWGAACGWSRDGSTLFVAHLTQQGRVLSAFDVNTGAGRKVRDLGLLHFSYYAYHSTGLSPSPDGKSLAASTLSIRFEPWVLDGLESPRSFWARMIGQ